MLVITLGDPHGVGIELLSRCRETVMSVAASGQAVVIIGNRWQFEHQLSALGHPTIEMTSITDFAQIKSLDAKQRLFFLEASPSSRKVDASLLKPIECGEVAVRSLMQLNNLNSGSFDSGERLAVVTGPIDKNSSQLAGWTWGGQTEFFESLWRSPAIMILAGPKLRVALATNHLALKHVTDSITVESVTRKLTLLKNSLKQQFGIECPHIAVCGLNPHASDGGLFGDTEAKVIAPAIAEFVKTNADVKVTGPLPADTVFYRAVQGIFDAVLAMYHDQGLGPLKTIHFDDAINISGGLPYLRVSPDHGPAQDLYLKGEASPRSMQAALNHSKNYLSGSLSQGRDTK